MNEVEADLARAKLKVENALVSVRVAEKAAMDADAALERIQRAVKQRSPRQTPQPNGGAAV